MKLTPKRKTKVVMFDSIALTKLRFCGYLEYCISFSERDSVFNQKAASIYIIIICLWETPLITESVMCRRKKSQFSFHIYGLTLGRTGEGGEGGCHPLRFFWFLFQGNKTSAPEVFCSCSFIHRAHFETRLLMAGYYGYNIWRHKWQVVKPFLSETAWFFTFFQE